MKIRIETPIARLTADLQENQVAELLQIALRYATGGSTNSTLSMKEFMASRMSEESCPADPAPKVFTPKADHKPKKSTTEDGYKGFLYIKCEGCGSTKGFCLRAPSKEAYCDCGHKTPLKDLKPLYVNCKCGENFKYMTNLTEDTASINCIHCGSPVDLEYHEKNGVYQTIE